jgi:phosphopantetheinyl transferase (holo-ACP synthase)
MLIGQTGFAAVVVASSPGMMAEGGADPGQARFRRRIAATIAGLLLSVPSEMIRIGQDPQGAPRLEAPAGALHLSFSARGRWNAIGIARQPVGIDIEPLDPGISIPWNMLRPDESDALMRLAEGAREEAFLRLWTAKEAVAKALRKGFRLQPEDIGLEGDRITLYDGTRGGWRDIAAERHAAILVSGTERLLIAAVLLSSSAHSFMRGGECSTPDPEHE